MPVFQSRGLGPPRNSTSVAIVSKENQVGQQATGVCLVGPVCRCLQRTILDHIIRSVLGCVVAPIRLRIGSICRCVGCAVRCAIEPSIQLGAGIKRGEHVVVPTVAVTHSGARVIVDPSAIHDVLVQVFRVGLQAHRHRPGPTILRHGDAGVPVQWRGGTAKLHAGTSCYERKRDGATRRCIHHVLTSILRRIERRIHDGVLVVGIRFGIFARILAGVLRSTRTARAATAPVLAPPEPPVSAPPEPAVPPMAPDPPVPEPPPLPPVAALPPSGPEPPTPDPSESSSPPHAARESAPTVASRTPKERLRIRLCFTPKILAVRNSG